jgi:hypothetical protein
MEKLQIYKFIRRNWIIPLIAIKSLFQSVIQIVWGLVSLGLLGWVIFFFNKEYPETDFSPVPLVLREIGNFILDNITLLIWILFIVYFYFEYLELRKLQGEKN